jgi:hypothetical protein
VLKRHVTAFSLAVLCSGGLIAAQAQQPEAQQPQSQPQTQQPETRTTPAEPSQHASQHATSTLTGCVYREEDVAGRAPNVAERAGVMEDYILAVDSAGTQASSPAGTPGAVGTSGSAGSGPMYKLEFVEDEKLRAVVGKKVEVTGRIDAEAGDSKAGAAQPTSETDKVVGRDRVDLAEFEVVSIREVEGSCPAKPSAR